MDVMVGFRLHLIDNAAIAALVSGRVYTPILPQKVTYPAIQLQLISDVEGMHLRGPDGCSRSRVQVDCWALTRDAAFAVGRLCRQRLLGFSGTWTGDASTSPYGQLRIMLVELQHGSEQFEQEVMGGMCRQTADYFVHFKDPNEQVLI